MDEKNTEMLEYEKEWTSGKGDDEPTEEETTEGKE